MIDPRDGVLQFEAEDSKLAEYLLNLAHVDGGPKAARLLRHNFDLATLRSVLMEHGKSAALHSVRPTPYGTRFEVADPIPTPLNTYLDIRSVWEVRPANPTVARLVTITFKDR